jgi:hypothetical protein
VQYFILLYIHICKQFSTSSCQSSQKSSSSSSLPYFACHDVIALIVIQPFAICQPLHVKFRCLSIFFILLRFLLLIVTFRGFSFQTLSMNSPGYISEPQHFDFNKTSVTNYCLKFSHVWFVIKSIVKIRI